MNIKFHKSIYKKNAITKAISEFDQLADFDIFSEGQYFVVQATKIELEFKNTLNDEFSNYVLSLLR